jgi:hypothetical protein
MFGDADFPEAIQDIHRAKSPKVFEVFGSEMEHVSPSGVDERVSHCRLPACLLQDGVNY